MSRLSSFAVIALFLLTVLSTSPAAAQIEGIGVGTAVGVTNGVLSANPVGVTVKGWMSERQALSGLTSFYLGGENLSYWTLQGDYLFHNFNAVQVEEGFLALYVGGGVQYTVREGTDNQWALRTPVGATYLSRSTSFDFFVEVAPTLRVSNPEALRFDGAIGFRYYFSSGGGTSPE